MQYLYIYFVFVEDGDTTRNMNIYKCLNLLSRYPTITSLIGPQ